ncbi:MAG: LacI family DNA-binding transcriptional regulator [Candidatus Humimicrobiaceae bacterium]
MVNKKINVNIKDIAKFAGVSVTTVSHALSGNRHVKPETKRKIFQIIKENNYEPNIVARSLSTKESKLIGIITTEINNECYSGIIEGIEEILGPLGYILVINSSGYDSERDASIFKKMNSLFIDCLILIGGSAGLDNIISYNTRDIPLILINRINNNSNHSQIILNYTESIVNAVNYLYNLGHEKIGYIGWVKKGEFVSEEKFKGYLIGLQNNNLNNDENKIFLKKDFINNGFNFGYNFIKSFIKKIKTTEKFTFTALICQTDQIALGILKALKESSINVPVEISLIGFGGISSSEFSDPSLTTMSIPNKNMGRTAAETFLEIISGNDKELNKEIIIDTQLLVRSSTKSKKK